MKEVKVAAAATEIVCDDSMVIAGSIQPHLAYGQEGKIRASSVGQNSRLLLKDNHKTKSLVSEANTIYWVGPRDDVLRPTGPFDPELPVIAFKREDGSMAALLFNHSTHTIGSRQGGVRSPGFYGLAAQELEDELGGTALFLLGAAGSTHNLTLPIDEMVLRIKNAVKEALSKAQKRGISRLESVKKELKYRLREFSDSGR